MNYKTHFIPTPFTKRSPQPQNLNCKADEWTKGFKIKTSTENGPLIQLSIQLSKLLVFCRCHSSAFCGFPAASAKFSTTQLSKSFQLFYPGKLLACLAELNAFHSDWYSAACFSLKSSTKAEHFSFCFGPSFENLCRQDWLNFDHARESRHAVTSFVHLSSNRWQAPTNHRA